MDRRGGKCGVDSMGKIVDGKEQEEGEVTSRTQDAGHWSKPRPGFLRTKARTEQPFGDTRKWVDDERSKDEIRLAERGLVILTAK